MGRQPLAQPWMNVYSLDTKVFSHPSIHSLSKLPHSLGILKKNLLLLTYGNKTDATLFDFTPNFPSEGKIFLKISSSPSKRMGWPSDTSLFLKCFFIPASLILFDHRNSFFFFIIQCMSVFSLPWCKCDPFFDTIPCFIEITFSIYAYNEYEIYIKWWRCCHYLCAWSVPVRASAAPGLRISFGVLFIIYMKLPNDFWKL